MGGVKAGRGVGRAKVSVGEVKTSSNGLGLTFEQYVISFFEIADLWTDSVDEVACLFLQVVGSE